MNGWAIAVETIPTLRMHLEEHYAVVTVCVLMELDVRQRSVLGTIHLLLSPSEIY
jgi:hypothetical protein